MDYIREVGIHGQLRTILLDMMLWIIDFIWVMDGGDMSTYSRLIGIRLVMLIIEIDFILDFIGSGRMLVNICGVHSLSYI